jgi:hypothetical protein
MKFNYTDETSDGDETSCGDCAEVKFEFGDGSSEENRAAMV